MWTGVRVWRAFPELRGYSEGACRRLVSTACVRADVSIWPSALASFVAGGGALAGLLAHADLDRDSLLVRSASLAAIPVLIVWVGAPALAALTACVLVRSLQAMRALRSMLRLARCPTCRYPLEGLRLAEPPGLDPNPAERRLRCPECGSRWTLMQLRISAIDMLPWDRRIPSRDVGTMRRHARGPAGASSDD